MQQSTRLFIGGHRVHQNRCCAKSRSGEGRLSRRGAARISCGAGGAGGGRLRLGGRGFVVGRTPGVGRQRQHPEGEPGLVARRRPACVRGLDLAADAGTPRMIEQ